MKKLVEVQEVEGEGLVALLGERVMIWCANYIYAGRLTGVNDTCVQLEDASVVYETGKLCEFGYKDNQSLPGTWYVQVGFIESFGKEA